MTLGHFEDCNNFNKDKEIGSNWGWILRFSSSLRADSCSGTILVRRAGFAHFDDYPLAIASSGEGTGSIPPFSQPGYFNREIPDAHRGPHIRLFGGGECNFVFLP